MLITHCSGRVGLNTQVHAASSCPYDSLPLILILKNRVTCITVVLYIGSQPAHKTLNTGNDTETNQVAGVAGLGFKLDFSYNHH